MSMSKGIRSYGPGKFIKLVDSYAYEVTLDGGADEEASYPDGGGWYGLIELDKATRDRIREIANGSEDGLTAEEGELINDSLAVIFFERSDGIVETIWYDDAVEADEAWAEIEEEVGGEEEEYE
jgi:hypothetical protein